MQQCKKIMNIHILFPAIYCNVLSLNKKLWIFFMCKTLLHVANYKILILVHLSVGICTEIPYRLVPWQDKTFSITKITDLNHIKILLSVRYLRKRSWILSCRLVLLLLLLPFKEALQNSLKKISLYCTKSESWLTLPLK